MSILHPANASGHGAPLAADAPGVGAVEAGGVFQQVAHHGSTPLLRQTLQLLVDPAVSIHAVIVISVDNAKRLLHIGTGTQHGMTRTKRFLPLRRHLIEIRYTGKILHCVAHLDLRSVPCRAASHIVTADTPHHLLHAGFDDKYDFGEARTNGIKNGVLHQDLSVGSNAVYLFVAAVAGSKTGCHNDKCRFHSRFLLRLFMFM